MGDIGVNFLFDLFLGNVFTGRIHDCELLIVFTFFSMDYGFYGRATRGGVLRATFAGYREPGFLLISWAGGDNGDFLTIVEELSRLDNVIMAAEQAHGFPQVA